MSRLLDLSLFDAIASGNMNYIVARLKQSPQSVNAVNLYGDSLLHVAADLHQLMVCELLLSHGADVNMKNKKARGETALHRAAFNGQEECMDLLIRHGALVDEEDEDGWVATHYAAIENRFGALKKLEKAGADLNRQDGNGFNLLHHSLIHHQDTESSKEILLWLIEQGVSLETMNQEGKVPLDYVKHQPIGFWIEGVKQAVAEKKELESEFLELERLSAGGLPQKLRL